MRRFVLQRLLSMLLVLFLVSIATFAIFQAIPNGDPAVRIAGRTATPETIEAVRHDWGFNDPLYEQYAITMKKVFTGEVVSYAQEVNVLEEIVRRLPVTLALVLGAAVLWMALATVAALLGATRPGSLRDRALMLGALGAVSIPAFFLGAIALYVFAYELDLLPNTGYVAFADSPWEWFTHLLLPWIVLSISYAGIYSRVLRASLIDTMAEDHVRTARAKGLPRRRVLRRHVLRNSLIPVVSLLGLDLAAAIGGSAILTETVFNLPGVGQYAAQSVANLDVPPVMVITMLTAFFVAATSAIVDIAYAYLDPRIRVDG
jgi:peptide/nickel transport system permease protein